MSSLALARADGTITPGEQLAVPVRARIKAAREWRKQFELGWMMSMGLAAGKHWTVADRNTRTLRRIQDVDPRYKGRELYSADEVTEYRTTMLGELGSDNDLPQLLLRRDDQASEELEAQANRAVQYGWQSEWRGDDILADVDRLIVDLGTCAVRCRFDSTVGPTRYDNVPHVDGKPLLSMDNATQALGSGPSSKIQMKPVKQGRIVWETLSPFNLVIPPGIGHEMLFPWECVMRPVPVTTIKALYPKTASDLQEDTDIGSILGTDARTPVGDGNAWASGDGDKGRLRDHAWLFTYYERPTPKYPDGRVLTFGGNTMILLDVAEELPYKDAAGQPCAGISYFHWWRVTGRFWSRSLVDAMKDGQRLLDKRRTQLNEIIDRSMPFTLVQKDSAVMNKSGVPGEFVEIGRDERQPVPVVGIQPGAWMQGDVEAIREDIEHATGVKGPRLGVNPVNVTTYSQLALISEQEQTKRDQIYRERKQALAKLIEFSLYDIGTYWGPEREIALAGDNGRLEAETFNATRLQDAFYVLQVAPGAAKPRTQASKLQMVQDIWNGIVNSRMPSPELLDWYVHSLQAGEPLELPKPQTDSQADKAGFENHKLLEGEQVPVAYYDLPAVHIPIHRQAQDQAQLVGDHATWELIENHVQGHLQAAQQAAQQVQAQASAGGPAGPPTGLPAASPSPDAGGTIPQPAPPDQPGAVPAGPAGAPPPGP